MSNGPHPGALALVDALRTANARIVLAESCTGGLVCAELVAVPGVSAHLCGSAVVYRLDTKIQWLGVSESDLAEHGAVSAVVAKAMARGVLERTPEADVAVSITGDLGPGAPAETDGIVHVGAATREAVEQTRYQMVAMDRAARREEAVRLVLERAVEVVTNFGARRNKPSKGDSTV